MAAESSIAADAGVTVSVGTAETEALPAGFAAAEGPTSVACG